MQLETGSNFLLNMQLIVDAFEESGYKVSFYSGKDRGCLFGVRVYHPGVELSSDYVYLILSEELPKNFLADAKWDGLFLIVLGKEIEELKNGQYTVVFLEDKNRWKIYDFVEEVFKYNAMWAAKLQQALNEDQGVEQLCELSYSYFENPLFVHDSSFYIIACPKRVPKMTKWEIDPITGLEMVPLSVINDFKLDEEYMETLKTNHSGMFSELQRGYRILYMNIWNDCGQYEGRVCVDELETSLKPGQFLAIEYLVKMLMVAIRRRNISSGTYTRPFEAFVRNVISKNLRHRETIRDNLRLNTWKIEDDYVCILLGVQERDRDMMTIVSTCNFIESRLHGSYAFLYENNILVLVDLTVSGESLIDYMGKLSIIIRESLFLAGISNIYHDFCQTPGYYRQAEIALEYGAKSGGMFWQFYFHDFPMDYIMDMATKELTPNQICSEKLSVLQAYDEKNGSALLKTLEIYLKNERNAMKTSRELFIHRSTLFYRLDKINDMIQLDLDDADVRLYLSLSYYILEHISQRKN